MPRSKGQAWAGSDRSSRLPSDWPIRRRRTFRRDGYRCRWTMPDGTRCPHTDKTARTLECDHAHRGDDHTLPNLQTLCGQGSPHNHHATKTGREGRATQPNRQRPTEQHPGMIEPRPGG